MHQLVPKLKRLRRIRGAIQTPPLQTIPSVDERAAAYQPMDMEPMSPAPDASSSPEAMDLGDEERSGYDVDFVEKREAFKVECRNQFHVDNNNLV